MECIALGAKGVVSFTSNIDRGYLPPASSIAYEGLYYNHYFNVGAQEKEKPFSPRFFSAITKDPINGETEKFVCVGLTGNLDGPGLYENKGRWPLDVVVVMDISGSMGSVFGQNSQRKTIMQVANESVVSMLDNLRDDDSFGMVLFDTNASTLQELKRWSDIDKQNLSKKILDVKTRGGTTLSKGFEAGYKMLQGSKQEKRRERRLFFFTDMLISKYEFDAGLKSQFQKAAAEGIYSSFVGMGIDFDTDAVECISSVKGCNYFSVNTPKEFSKLMKDEFDYITTIDVFDAQIKLSSNAVTPEYVYGSPGNEVPKDGVLCKITSSSPSLLDHGRTKGGVIVVKVSSKSKEANSFSVDTSYTSREGEKYQFSNQVEFPKPTDTDYFENACIRKAVLLTRYVRFLKSYLNAEDKKGWNQKFDVFKKYLETEIDVLEEDEEALTKELENFDKIHKLAIKQQD